MSSAKNKLQEYCQKQHLALPIYTVVRVGGPDHQPLYQATLCCDDRSFTGEIYPSKTQASVAVAEQALKVLMEREPSRKMGMGTRTVLFVDVENMPNFIDEVVKKIDGMTIYAFVGHHHCLAKKTWGPSNVIKIISHSTRLDGTDTAMQVYVGYHLTLNNYDRYYIATRDHYGSALVEMITVQPGPWERKMGYLVTQVEHILETYD